jgi:hypothetical protein
LVVPVVSLVTEAEVVEGVVLLALSELVLQAAMAVLLEMIP